MDGINLPVSSNDLSGYLNNYSSANFSTYSDPDQFRLFLAKSMNDQIGAILDNKSDDDDDDNNDSVFGSLGSYFSGNSQIGNQYNSLDGSATMQMIVQANLIGKTVKAFNPQTGQTITGKVESVSRANGQVLINVGGTNVLPENLITITEGGDQDV